MRSAQSVEECHFLAGVTPADSGDAPSWRVFSSFLASFNHREHRPPHDQMINRDGRRDESFIIRDWLDLKEGNTRRAASVRSNTTTNPGRTKGE